MEDLSASSLCHSAFHVFFFLKSLDSCKNVLILIVALFSHQKLEELMVRECSIHTMECYIAVKKEQILDVCSSLDLTSIMLKEAHLTQTVCSLILFV